jgi:hypothetical protein
LFAFATMFPNEKYGMRWIAGKQRCRHSATTSALEPVVESVTAVPSRYCANAWKKVHGKCSRWFSRVPLPHKVALASTNLGNQCVKRLSIIRHASRRPTDGTAPRAQNRSGNCFCPSLAGSALPVSIPDELLKTASSNRWQRIHFRRTMPAPQPLFNQGKDLPCSP